MITAQQQQYVRDAAGLDHDLADLYSQTQDDTTFASHPTVVDEAAQPIDAQHDTQSTASFSSVALLNRPTQPTKRIPHSHRGSKQRLGVPSVQDPNLPCTPPDDTPKSFVGRFVYNRRHTTPFWAARWKAYESMVVAVSGSHVESWWTLAKHTIGFAWPFVCIAIVIGAVAMLLLTTTALEYKHRLVGEEHARLLPRCIADARIGRGGKTFHRRQMLVCFRIGEGSLINVYPTTSADEPWIYNKEHVLAIAPIAIDQGQISVTVRTLGGSVLQITDEDSRVAELAGVMRDAVVEEDDLMKRADVEALGQMYDDHPNMKGTMFTSSMTHDEVRAMLNSES